MKYLPKNTLAHYNAAPQVHRHDLSQMPVAVFAAATKEYRKNCGLAFPNDEAVTFYVLNHCASIVRKAFTLNEPLPEWALKIMDAYTKVCSQQGLRMLHYILSITTREMRHVPSKGETFWNGMVAVAGPQAMAFVKANKAPDETAAVQRYMNNPPNCTVGQYIEAMSYGFWKGWGDYSPANMHSWSGGYGGPKWALVADAAKVMLHGKTSMEMLVDTGFTLAHNGGPIFNKGMMYSQYDHAFLTILDVQRSGQMPDLILDTQNYGVKKTDEAKEVVSLLMAARPNEFKKWVDWVAVDAVRPDKAANPGKYAAYIKKQQQLHPTTPAAKKALEKTLGGKKVKITGEWEVFPGQTVQVFERVGA